MANLTWGGAESFDSWMPIPNTTAAEAANTPLQGLWTASAAQAVATGFDGGGKCLDGVVGVGANANLPCFFEDANAEFGSGFLRFRARRKAGATAADIAYFVRGSQAPTGIIVAYNSSFEITVRKESGGATINTGVILPLQGAGDLRIEMYCHCESGTDGEWELKINGVSVASQDNVNTAQAGSLNNTHGFAFKGNTLIQIDDIAWKYGALEAEPDDFIESATVPVQIVRLRPDQVGTFQQWSAENITATFTAVTAVNESTADMTNAVWLNAASGSVNKKQTYRHENLAAIDGLADGTLAILCVVQAYHAKDDAPNNNNVAGNENFKPICIGTDGATYQPAVATVGIDGITDLRYSVYPTDPVTTAAWQRDNLNDSEFGLWIDTALINQEKAMHFQHLYVVLGAGDGVSDDEPEPDDFAADACDTKGDVWFVDSGVRFDGRNADPTVTVTIADAGNGFDSGDEVFVVANTPATFTSDFVGRQMLLEGADGATVLLTVTAFSTGELLVADLNADAPASLQATATAIWESQKQTLTGLAHLEGEAVNVVGDGIPKYSTPATKTRYVVASGAITLDDFYGVIIAGLYYPSDLETLDLDVDGGDAVRDRRKSVGRASIAVEYTRNISIGMNASSLSDSTVDANAGALALPTKTITRNVPFRWDVPGRIYIQQNEPLPMSILGVITDAGAGGRASV